MIRRDFPYLCPCTGPESHTIGADFLARFGRSLSGDGGADDETGDVSAGAWFCRFNLIPWRDTFAGMVAELRKSHPEEWTEETRKLDDTLAAALDGNRHRMALLGVIYGRDSDGFEIVGGWSDADRYAGAWNRLVGVWADPESGKAGRQAATDSQFKVAAGTGFRLERALGFRTTSVAFRLVHDSGADVLIQLAPDRVGIASCFGYIPRGPLGCECFRYRAGYADCTQCGKTAADFHDEAAAYIEELTGTGIRAEDPGYFTFDR